MTDVHRIGKMRFGVLKFVISNFMKKYVAIQRYQHQFGIHTYYLITNGNSIAWLVNISDVFFEKKQVGGLMQVLNKTFILDLPDYALVPTFMYPKSNDFSFLNIQNMFMWMSSYPQLVVRYGLTPVKFPTEPEYINVESFFKDFM